ncbi:type II secretion system protein N [Alkalimarinus sediminis]|uniref:Type II secretion system protein GspC N-terminal domain-containing protein n=1 Tax=Alkalimarinus sediminis TaxID=1632866 RepID=A0A9E8KKJ3_9ALTE|nr:type II secretion system protein N [Alkalimarinus sediminis]UZW76221.1 hypothetical protein NNL22_06475 [Alkalimarinus sediminis]
MNTLGLQQKAPVVILVLLILAMLFTLGLQAYEFFMPGYSESSESAPVKEASTSTTRQQPRPELNVDQYELFGKPIDPNQQQQAVKTEDLPKTNLRLTLRGVSASTKIEQASALIEGPNKETLKYSVNDTLPGNAKLKSVHEKRIVIERNGRLENLYFPEDVNIGIVRNDSNRDSQNRPQSQLQPQAHTQPVRTQPIQVPQIPQNFSRPTTNLDNLSEERKQEIKSRLEKLREKMKQTP